MTSQIPRALHPLQLPPPHTKTLFTILTFSHFFYSMVEIENCFFSTLNLSCW